ncbi:hypothetical protein HanIR_Chr16g0817461 [Helianthus annuus]|nr:hypothetical protein HanIR_Chr16g0817461 [Helianthus annuus]
MAIGSYPTLRGSMNCILKVQPYPSSGHCSCNQSVVTYSQQPTAPV